VGPGAVRVAIPAHAEQALITLDTSALIGLLDRREADHARLRKAFLADGGPYMVPAWILAEATYLVGRRLGAKTLDVLLGDLETGAFSVRCGDEDVARIRELVSRYADLPLSVADAAVVACAERSGGSVLSLDRDFAVVAKEGKITIHPA